MLAGFSYARPIPTAAFMKTQDLGHLVGRGPLPGVRFWDDPVRNRRRPALLRQQLSQNPPALPVDENLGGSLGRQRDRGELFGIEVGEQVGHRGAFSERQTGLYRPCRSTLLQCARDDFKNHCSIRIFFCFPAENIDRKGVNGVRFRASINRKWKQSHECSTVQAGCCLR